LLKEIKLLFLVVVLAAHVRSTEIMNSKSSSRIEQTTLPV